jgi:hypothetical protein
MSFVYRIAASLIALGATAACGTRDHQLEQRLTEAVRAEIRKGLSHVDLRTFPHDGWLSACVQTPYLTEEDFESLIGRKAPGFEMQHQDDALWFFYEDGHALWAKVRRREIRIERENGLQCIQRNWGNIRFTPAVSPPRE